MNRALIELPICIMCMWHNYTYLYQYVMLGAFKINESDELLSLKSCLCIDLMPQSSLSCILFTYCVHYTWRSWPLLLYRYHSVKYGVQVFLWLSLFSTIILYIRCIYCNTYYHSTQYTNRKPTIACWHASIHYWWKTWHGERLLLEQKRLTFS